MSIYRAAATVRQGGVIAYPTEGVYGLGCAPACRQAVLRIKRLKRRPAQLGLILVAADLAQLRGYIRMPPGAAGARVRAAWPGPVSWVLPAGPAAPAWIRGPGGSVAARVSAYSLVRALCPAGGPSGFHQCQPARSPPGTERRPGARLLPAPGLRACRSPGGVAGPHRAARRAHRRGAAPTSRAPGCGGGSVIAAQHIRKPQHPHKSPT